jgi:hypothetical protein
VCWYSAGKCCGGFIAPDAQLILARFGLGIPKSVLLSPQLFAVRTIDFDNSLERYYQRHYINIDREEFDKWLISIVNKNVDVIENCVFKSFEYCKVSNKMIFKFREDIPTGSIQTSFVKGSLSFARHITTGCSRIHKLNKCIFIFSFDCAKKRLLKKPFLTLHALPFILPELCLPFCTSYQSSP